MPPAVCIMGGRFKCLLVLPAFLLIISSTLIIISCAHGASHQSLQQTTLAQLPPPQQEQQGHSKIEVINDGEEEYDVLVGTRRWILEVEGEEAYNSTLVLAAARTNRIDPLDGRNRYMGGWNISNEHYWASVAYTAAPLFLIGIVWFMVFGLTLFVIGCCYCCCRRQPYGYSRTAYALSLIFLLLFTIAAIIGCIVLYTSQGKFHGSTTSTLKYVVKQASITVDKLHRVSDTLSAAKKAGVDNVFLPSDVQTRIDQIDSKINASGTDLGRRTHDNSEKIQNALDNMRVSLITIASIMLLLAFLGFLFSLLGLRFLVYTLVIIGWLLVAGTFILCGFFLVLHNVVGDACVAMDQWVKNPTAHSALDDIVPCVDSATANQTLYETKEVVYQLASGVNEVITNVSNINFAPNFPTVYYNQSGPLMPVLCNPFHPDMTDRNCSSGEVDLSNATEVWRNYICEVSAAEICTTVGRLTPKLYDQMATSVNVSYGLNKDAPFLVELEDCSFVRETFTEISSSYCPKLQRYSKWTYVGLVMVSTAVMLSLVFWIVYSRERRHRVYTKQYIAGVGGQSPSAQHKDPIHT